MIDSEALRESEEANLARSDRMSALACYLWSAIGLLLIVANLLRWWLS